MLPLNLNLQLNATSALWANDSTLEILHKHILKYDQEMASKKINKIQCVARNTINKVKNTVKIV
jgi:hypothetical protein